MLHCSNDLRGGTEFYCKASFIKISDIILMDIMFLNSFLYSFKLLSYNIWILLLCMLI